MPARLLSENNVNMNQRAAWDACGGDSAEFVGSIRLDSIGFRDIVIPDTHFFDGMFFLQDRDPASLMEATARGERSESPLIFLTRGADLQSSLFSLLGQGDLLNGVQFQSIIDRAAAESLATLLANTPTTQLTDRLREDTVASDLADFIKDLAKANGLDVSTDLAMIERGWSRWLAAEKAGVLRIEPYGHRLSAKSLGSHRPLDLVAGMDWQQVARPMTDTATATVDAISRLVRSGNTNRSLVQRIVRDAKVGADPHLEPR